VEDIWINKTCFREGGGGEEGGKREKWMGHDTIASVARQRHEVG
jgi:hypothetical protein